MTCGIMKEMEESQCYACLSPQHALQSARSKLRLLYGINVSCESVQYPVISSSYFTVSYFKMNCFV